MIRLIITLLIVALIAAILGFTGLALAAAGIAKIIFWIAIVLLIISTVFKLLNKAT